MTTTLTAPPAPQEAAPTQLFTVKQFCERHPWATDGGIRHLIFNRATNGFADCIKRIGRRILLDEGKVLEWVDAQPN